jgi:hypothetical protein
MAMISRVKKAPEGMAKFAGVWAIFVAVPATTFCKVIWDWPLLVAFTWT